MNRTNIEWVKNPDGTQGYTWNPITGCLNGCSYCYARKLANGRLKSRYLANTNVADVTRRLHDPNSSLWDRVVTDPFYPRFWEDRLFQPFNDKHISQKGIFVCDMSDLFGIGIPEKWTKAVMDVIEDCPTDRFYLLTKQPQNLIKFSPFPDNCFVGVSATDFKMFAEATLYLSAVEAKVKYISFEPLLQRIGTDVKGGYGAEFLADDFQRYLDWVIIGSQTKPTIYPKDQWVREIEGACDKAGIPVFEKNNLYPKGFAHLLRQEMPIKIPLTTS